MIKNYLLPLLLTLICSSCASRKFEDVLYLEKVPNEESLKLNVFQPRHTKDSKPMPVVIFVHGGYWAEGDKDIYGFLGRNFAKHDVVTVIPSYTLSPKANYDTMAKEIAKAVEWTVNNIEEYHGNPEQIYLMGHSAGGHLIALISTNPRYLKTPEVIKGVILNDAAGLDMYTYLQNHPPTAKYHYKTTWTTDPEQWKKASPLYFVDEKAPPFLIYIGKKTYASIKKQNAVFIDKLNEFQKEIQPIYLDKKHVPMMSQYFFPWTKRYDEILSFINTN
ncbi:alpha/beta hydrolase [Lacinutrix neustonica]|uniref:Alpha/beta hydrolase n=1 Tax=Lacinutrix neustonica TaxID=2980107 RepID=A0A9E8MVQ8_9FLAO|nr:alpha/beta hydrolase [Lacinutrix neustonica]WAC02246.1 alpha/beta hydrolase [Lacinutrix neustonica]